MNGKVVLLVVGLIAGALVGYLTRPQAAEIRIGGLSIEVQGGGTAQGSGPMTSGQWQYVALLAAIGGAIGAGIGFVVDRRRT
jgi:hypothetical protein